MTVEQVVAAAVSILLAVALVAAAAAATRAAGLAEARLSAAASAAVLASLVSADVRESRTASCEGNLLALDAGRVVYTYVPDPGRIVRNAVPLPYEVGSAEWSCRDRTVTGTLEVVRRLGLRTVSASSAFTAALRGEP